MRKSGTAENIEQPEKQQETEIQESDLREQAELDSYTLSQPSFAQNKHAGMAFTHILHDNFFWLSWNFIWKWRSNRFYIFLS